MKMMLILRKMGWVIWTFILLGCYFGLEQSVTLSPDSDQAEKISAATKAKLAMDTIKEYRLDQSIELNDPTRGNKIVDPYETGMIGYWMTDITTTSGDLEAKQLSTNPNFAAMIVDMFSAIGLKPGDQVGVMLSGSFPALNISMISAIETVGLDACIMASIGASNYGATIPEFTFYDMVKLLNDRNILSNSIDYLSLGGENDNGEGFLEATKNAIKSRVDENTIWIDEDNYQENVLKRMQIFAEETPKMKAFLNVGGHQSAIGQGFASFIGQNGLLFKTKRLYSSDRGLINRYLEQNIAVVHLIQVKDLALTYQLPTSAAAFEVDSNQAVYYTKQAGLFWMIVPISLSVLVLGGFIIKKKES